MTATSPPADRALSRYPFLRDARPAFEVARTEGCWLIAPDGRRVLDAAGGAIVANVGHGRTEIADAMRAAALDTSFVVPPFLTAARERLTARLRERWLPAGLTRVIYASGGSEGMDMAMRLARLHHFAAGRPQRTRVLGRTLSYHGTTLATLALGDHRRRRHGYEPMLLDLLGGDPRPPAHYCLRCPLGLTFPQCGVACAGEVGRAIEQAGPETVAAFAVEPVVGANAGALVPPGDYLPRVAEICRRHGVLLIADEVMTGFGRTGRRFAVEHWDVAPDILVSGKGLSGGYAPLAAVVATDAVVAPIAEAGEELMFHTYGAHSACCAAADAALDILERERLVERAAELGPRLAAKLRAALADHPHVAEIRGLGLLWGIELVRDRATLEPFPVESKLIEKVMTAGLELGVFLYPGGNAEARHVIVLGPPLIVSEAELDHLAAALPPTIDRAVAAVS
ncbi:MAG TPA: aminotransferase class III-fold pyridoxal phosphate-dependent enzyme [Thermoanaerobaculia bacterium]|nr:aminotransferase class III-fold pyridoxal phosphate-dependent enzyme [Thermoanaerobaculia bacterium]